jgi:hypothetical protein
MKIFDITPQFKARIMPCPSGDKEAKRVAGMGNDSMRATLNPRLRAGEAK